LAFSPRILILLQQQEEAAAPAAAGDETPAIGREADAGGLACACGAAEAAIEESCDLAILAN
jgi:hypothetical protein